MGVMGTKQCTKRRCVEGIGRPFDAINSAPDEAIATVRASDDTQTIVALGAAQEAFRTWWNTFIKERLA